MQKFQASVKGFKTGMVLSSEAKAFAGNDQRRHN
jgi:hypothetical protein